MLLFILGIIFIELIIPTIENICGVILTALELLKGNMSIKIAEINAKIKDINKNIPEENIRQIGFVIPDSDENYDEEDEDDEI